MKEESKRIIEWSKGCLLPPSNMDFLLTSRCNLRCKFCRFGIEKRKIDHSKDITYQEVLRTVDEGLKLGIKNWYIEGGEPLFYSDKLLQIIKMIKEYDTYGNFNTNGTLFTDEIIQKIIEIEWDEITFSIDSANPEIHDELRGVPGTFDKSITAIKKIQEMKMSLGKDKPVIGIHSVITNKNYNQLDEIIKLAHRLKVESVHFTHLFEDTKHFNELKLGKKHICDFEKNVKDAYKLAIEWNIRNNLNEYIKTISVEDLGKMDTFLKAKGLENRNNKILSIPCFTPWFQMIVLNNGTVGYCSRFDEEIESENIKTKKLKDIWYGKHFEKIRKEMIRGKFKSWCHMCPTSMVIHNEELRNYLKNTLKAQ